MGSWSLFAHGTDTMDGWGGEDSDISMDAGRGMALLLLFFVLNNVRVFVCGT